MVIQLWFEVFSDQSSTIFDFFCWQTSWAIQTLPTWNGLQGHARSIEENIGASRWHHATPSPGCWHCSNTLHQSSKTLIQVMGFHGCRMEPWPEEKETRTFVISSMYVFDIVSLPHHQKWISWLIVLCELPCTLFWQIDIHQMSRVDVTSKISKANQWETFQRNYNNEWGCNDFVKSLQVLFSQLQRDLN